MRAVKLALLVSSNRSLWAIELASLAWKDSESKL
jgi:hypothetical protein